MSNTKNNEELSALVSELRSEIVKLKKELKTKSKYGLTFERRSEKVVDDCETKLPVLKENIGRKIETDKNKPTNIIIEGDNYHSLQVLNYTHQDKIDVIYIDPPYNTGNKDFIYNDNFVDREDGFRDSKWLSFMERRLVLARDLLSESGVIFISIDDNEQSQLKLLCDFIFGRDNFIVNFIVNSAPAGTQSSKNVSIQHSYCLCYARNINNIKFILERTQSELENRYSEQDERGNYYYERLWKRGIGGRKEDVPSLYFPVYYNPKTKKILIDNEYRNDKDFIKIIPYHTLGVLGRWTWSRDTMKNGRDNLIVKKVADKWKLHKKVYEESEVGKLPFSIIGADIGRTEMGSLEVKKIFNKKVFDYPKPLNLISYFLSITNNKTATILDFFAGSGTTGHAVMELNKKDNGDRQFILCTNNGDEKSEHKIASDVCYPRIQKVIEGYINTDREKVEGLGGNLCYLKTTFIDKKKNKDEMKFKITSASTEILCLKEGVFDIVEEVGDEYSPTYKIIKGYTQNGPKVMGIYFDIDDRKLDEMRKKLLKYKEDKVAYLFSLTNESLDINHNDWLQIKIEPIPEKILKVYESIYKLNKK